MERYQKLHDLAECIRSGECLYKLEPGEHKSFEQQTNFDLLDMENQRLNAMVNYFIDLLSIYLCPKVVKYCGSIDDAEMISRELCHKCWTNEFERWEHRHGNIAGI